jgi:hypothetical protein
MGGTSVAGTNFGVQNSTSTTTPDPNAYNYYLAGLSMASNLAGIPYEPYTGPTVAGFSQDQLAAMQGVREIPGMVNPYIDQATQLAARAYDLSSPSNFSQAAVNQYFNPLMNEFIKNAPTTYSQQAVSQYYDPRLQAYLNNAPLNYSAEAVNQYYNPYQQQVIDATRAQIEQQNAQQMSQQQADAIRSGAFGGDRTGAARAQLAGQQSLAQNTTLGNLRQQGYQNALNAFMAQQQQALGIAQQQQQSAQSMFGTQQAAGLNARQQTYAQALAQYNQQQAQAIQAAQNASLAVSQLGGQKQQAALQGYQALLGTGQLQQQQVQRQYDQNANQWYAAQGSPYNRVAAYLSAAGLAPGMGGTTNTNSVGYGTSNQNQSGGNPYSQAIGAATSLFGAFNLSDERAKTNIDYVGEDPNTGDKLYAYDYKSDVARSEENGEPMPPKRVSPMAQEVAEKNPDDVVDLGGLLGVKLGREGRANGGPSSSYGLETINLPPIYLDTGEMATPSQYADLSRVAYNADPNLSTVKPSGLSALFTPSEQREKIKSRWVSPDIEEKELELKPFESGYLDEEDREEKASGGTAYDQALQNLVKENAVPNLKTDWPKTHDLGYIPGLPALPGGPMDIKAGRNDQINDIAKGVGKIGAKYLKKPKGASAIGASPAVEVENTTPAPTDKASSDIGGGITLGGIGDYLKNIFNEGGRVGRADGGGLPGFGNVTGSQLGPVGSPYTSGLINNVPAGVGAFNRPVNTGVTVQEAFGPRGLGRDIPQSLANFRMPWSNVNTGSTSYNNLLLKAAKGVGPRQLTPQEFGFSGITPVSYADRSSTATTSVPTQSQIDAEGNPVTKANLQNQLDLANLKAKYPNLFNTPTNYTYQATNWLTPEGNYFMVPVSGYGTAPFYVNPFAKGAPTYKADGGAVHRASGGSVSERYPLSAQYLGEPEQDPGRLAQGIYPAVREVAFGNPEPGMHVMQEKTLGFGPVEMSHGGRAGYEEGGAPEEDVDIDRYLSALAKGESGGHKDPYAVVGPKSRKGDLPYGKYQVMGANIPSWSEEAGLGRLTPQEFLANPDAQEAVARHKFGEYMKKTGSPEKAAAMWFGGPGYASHMGARDVLGTSIPQYMSRFSANAGRPGGDVVATDRGDEDTGLISKASASDDGDMLQPVRHALGGDRETEPGLFGFKPLINRDLAMYLMATGAGMAASRSRSPLQAFGEGSLQGIEALQASRAGRSSDDLHAMQMKNLQSEIARRNAETEELIRKIAARKRLLGGTPPGGGPISSDTSVATPTTAAPTVDVPEAPKIVEGEATQPKSLMEKTAEAEKPGVEPAAPATPKAAPSVDPIDTEIAKASSDEKKFSLMAQRLLAEGLDAEAAKFEKLATDAQNNRKTLMQEKRKSLTEKVDESSPLGVYRKATSDDTSEFKSTLDEARSIIENNTVKFGPMAPTIAKGKTLTKELSQEFLPEEWQPDIDTSAATLVERLGAIGKEATIEKLGGKLGAGVSNADVTFMMDTDFNPAKSREYNMAILAKKEALLAKKEAIKEEALRYRQQYGINSNFSDHMAEWGKKHPIQSFMRKEAEHKAGQVGGSSKEGDQSPLDALRSKYPNMNEDQMRELYTKLKSGAQ